jgi:hypothetical protein
VVVVGNVVVDVASPNVVVVVESPYALDTTKALIPKAIASVIGKILFIRSSYWHA